MTFVLVFLVLILIAIAFWVGFIIGDSELELKSKDARLVLKKELLEVLAFDRYNAVQDDINNRATQTDQENYTSLRIHKIDSLIRQIEEIL